MTHDPLCPATCGFMAFVLEPPSKCRGGDCTLCGGDCQCDLIARVRADQRENDAYELDEAKIREDERAKSHNCDEKACAVADKHYAAGLQAARDAVAALTSSDNPYDEPVVLYVSEALAAIDARRGE